MGRQLGFAIGIVVVAIAGIVYTFAAGNEPLLGIGGSDAEQKIGAGQAGFDGFPKRASGQDTAVSKAAMRVDHRQPRHRIGGVQPPAMLERIALQIHHSSPSDLQRVTVGAGVAIELGQARDALGLRVQVDNDDNRGTVKIVYGSLEQLDDICRRLLS